MFPLYKAHIEKQFKKYRHTSNRNGFFFLDKCEVFKTPWFATVGFEPSFLYTSVSNKLLSMIEIV